MACSTWRKDEERTGGMDGAGSIGLGLTWDLGIYVQQVWQRGELHYLVINDTNEPIELLVAAVSCSTGKCAPDRTLAGPWPVPAASFEVFPVPEGALSSESDLIAFRLGTGLSLGWLRAPVPPIPSALAVVNNEGVNGSGGDPTGPQIEADFLVARATSFTLDLVLPPGDLTLPFHTDAVQGAQFFDIVAARSDRAVVLPTREGFTVIVTAAPEDAGDSPPTRVQVDVALPADFSGGRFAIFKAWWCTDSRCLSGYGISRAIPLPE